jgi:yecA family protein
MSRPAVSYDELDERLRGDGRGGYVGLSAIDGLIAAVVAGPVVIPSTRWLPPIFGDKMPQTKPGSLEERIVNTVLNRHDEVEALLSDAPGNYRPIFMHHKSKLYVDDWAVGFALGLGMGGEAWGPILLAQPRPIIAPIMVVNPQLSKMLFRVPLNERRKLRATAHQHIGPAFLQLYAMTRTVRANQ